VAKRSIHPLEPPPTPLHSLLPIERAPRVLVPTEPDLDSGEGSGVEIYQTQDYPLLALVLRAPTLPALARAGSQCLDRLLEADVPHSLLMDGDNLYIMPRQKNARKPFPFAVLPGFPEASGLLLVMDQDDFEDERRLNADVVWKIWSQDMSLEEGRFQEVVTACVKAAGRRRV
jgi:hypothetical protein